MAMSGGYKPSPLGYGSPRSSPFRRPESPSSPSPLRQAASPESPTKAPGRLAQSRFPNSTVSSQDSDMRTSKSYAPRGEMSLQSPITMNPSSSRAQPAPPVSHGNSLSQLQPAQVRILRDSFSILDRDGDGVVTRDDVADMLNQLGLPSSQSAITQFFPPSAPQTMSPAVYLNSLATALAAMSPSTELMSAFSAFDDDDSGQVDLAELRDALINTAPEPGERALSAAEVDKIMSGFSGRRAFSKSMAGGLGKRGEVFKYQDFVNSIVGGNGASEPSSNEGSEG